MKTVNEKAESILNEISCCDQRTDIGRSLAIGFIVTLLKEQDRDTRHACAVAVNSMEGDFKLISQAYNIIMNTKVV